MTAVVRPEFRRIHYDEESPVANEVTVIAYARYSTDNQSSASTEDQLRTIRRSIQFGEVRSLLFPGAKFTLGYEFKDDAISGFGMVGREGLDAALSIVRQGKAKVIVVSDFKRFLRGMGAALTIYDFLQDYQAELISVSDDFSSAAKSARLQFMNKAYASEEFLETISNDTRRGLNARRYEGFSDGHLWLGVGSRPTRKVTVKGKLKDAYFDYFIIPHLADLVRRIFVLAKDGHSQKEIAKIMNSERVPPPGSYDKEGNIKEGAKRNVVWRDKTVWQILNNKSYIGIIERGKTKLVKKADGTKAAIDIPRSQWLVIERPDLRIVQQDLWDAVRERFKEYNLQKLKKTGSGKPFRHDGTTNHVLTGLCACGVCDGPFVVVSGRKGGFYGCRNSHRQHTCENRKVVSWKKFELPVLRFIIDQINNDDTYRLLANKYNEFRKSRIHTDVGELGTAEAKLDEVELAITNIVKTIERGTAPESLVQRLVALENEKQSLSSKVKFLQGVDQSEIYVTPGTIKMRLAEVPDLLQQSQPFEVNRALKPLIGKGGIKLVRRPGKDGKECYWTVGSINIGKAMGLVQNESAMDAGSVNLEVPVELELG